MLVVGVRATAKASTTGPDDGGMTLRKNQSEGGVVGGGCDSGEGDAGVGCDSGEG